MNNNQNTQFGGDTGIDADYLYEHDQINESIEPKRNNKVQFLKQAEKSDLIDIIGIIREDWDRVDFLESYQDEWESVPKKAKDCKEQMVEYLHNTYDKSLLQDIIMDYRYSNGLTDDMPRCPYDIGEGQKQCPKFEMMEDYEEGQPFYCSSTLIDNSKGWCEIGFKN